MRSPIETVVEPPGGTTVVRECAVAGVLEFRPQVHADERGRFVTTFSSAVVTAATGVEFRLEQASSSRSTRSVIRGVHYTRTPPGVQKIVTCSAGRVLDIVVDLRVGSPDLGRWDSVVLDAATANSLYVPIGVGHAFVALEEDSVMSYLITRAYVPSDELEVSVLDPELDLPVREHRTDLLSARDRKAPTLREAADRGLLPDADQCRRLEAATACGRRG